MQSERSGKQYKHLSTEERVVLMVMLDAGQSLRAIAARLGWAPSTLSRELARRLGNAGERYDASVGGARGCGTSPGACPSSAWARCCSVSSSTGCAKAGRPNRLPDESRRSYADDPARRASHETIYTALYVLPHGELRRELIACLRQNRSQRSGPGAAAWTGKDKSLI